MAKDKKSFIAYVDWKETFDSLPDEIAGKLIKHLFAYVNDENPQTDDIIIKAVFANIRQTLKRDLVKYEKIREKRSEAGKASANKRQQVLTSVESVQQSSTNSTVSVNVNDNVNKEIYIYNKFYDEQLELSDNNPEYKKFIDWMFGDNLFKRPLNSVLKMPEQLSWKQFPALVDIHKSTGVKISDCLIELDDWLMANPKKKNKTVVGTLRTFANNKIKR